MSTEIVLQPKVVSVQNDYVPVAPSGGYEKCEEISSPYGVELCEYRDTGRKVPFEIKAKFIIIILALIALIPEVVILTVWIYAMGAAH
jgi:hypothetical protein